MDTKKLIIEVEHSEGGTRLAFELDVTDIEDVKVTKVLNCSHADSDADYIFETENVLIRIQED